MQPLIVVPANDIDTSGMSVEVDLPVSWITHQVEDASARGVAPGRFSARLSRSGKADIVVRGRVTANVELSCARCLAPVVTPAEAEISLLLKPRPPLAAAQEGARRGSKARPAAADYEFTASEADEDAYDGERVVLDDFVREAILLELPRFPLCSESCPGIDGAPAEKLSKNPFEALRHLLVDGGADAGPAVRRPSAAEVRRAARARSRTKPKMRSSLASRSKK